MGWSSGTEIFDKVTDELLEIHYKAYDTDLPLYRIYNLLSALKDELFKSDWDTENESKYWNHHTIGRILGNDFEEHLTDYEVPYQEESGD